MSEATIPPPSDGDRAIQLDTLYVLFDDNVHRLNGIHVLALIRRCHAAETALAAKDARIAELDCRVGATERTPAHVGELCKVARGYDKQNEAELTKARVTIAELREALQKCNNNLANHKGTCSSYSTSSDDMVEHFDPSACDCGFADILARTAPEAT